VVTPKLGSVREVQIARDLSAWPQKLTSTSLRALVRKLGINPLHDFMGYPMRILKNNKHELFAYPDYDCARWRHRHGKPGRLGFDQSFRSGGCAVRRRGEVLCELGCEDG
jgi:hypothetical protein